MVRVEYVHEWCEHDKAWKSSFVLVQCGHRHIHASKKVQKQSDVKK
jgi:hypothetical protein